MKMLRKLQYVVDFIVESLTFDIILCFCIPHTHMNEQAEPLQIVFSMSFGHKWKTLQKKNKARRELFVIYFVSLRHNQNYNSK